MEKNIQFSLEFHYEFYDDSIHVMDARSFNFCELQLLKAIEELQKYVGEAKIEVGIEKRAEGSLIETIILTLENLSESKAFIALLTAFLTYFFTKKRSKLEDVNKRLEILDKIKKADLTKEEEINKMVENIKTDYFSFIFYAPGCGMIERCSKMIERKGKMIKDV